MYSISAEAWALLGLDLGLHPGDLGVRLNSNASLHPGSSPASHAEINHTLLKDYLEELKGHFSCVNARVFLRGSIPAFDNPKRIADAGEGRLKPMPFIVWPATPNHAGNLRPL